MEATTSVNEVEGFNFQACSDNNLTRSNERWKKRISCNASRLFFSSVLVLAITDQKRSLPNCKFLFETFFLVFFFCFYPWFNFIYRRSIDFEEYLHQGKHYIKVHLKPKYFFRSNKSLHLFETHCAFLPLFNPNLDFLQAVKVTKSGHYLLHDRASKGFGSIPGCTWQTDFHRIKPL